MCACLPKGQRGAVIKSRSMRHPGAPLRLPGAPVQGRAHTHVVSGQQRRCSWIDRRRWCWCWWRCRRRARRQRRRRSRRSRRGRSWRWGWTVAGGAQRVRTNARRAPSRLEHAARVEGRRGWVAKGPERTALRVGLAAPTASVGARVVERSVVHWFLEARAAQDAAATTACAGGNAIECKHALHNTHGAVSSACRAQHRRQNCS